MCVYIFGRFTFKILGQAHLLWFIVCFLNLKYCYLLLLSLFISITIISIIISVTVTTAKYIVITFQFFATLITYILAICWFKIWFPFCFLFVCLFVCSFVCFFFLFSKLYTIIFCGVFKLYFVPFFFPNSFSIVTVNCNNRGKIQINEFERHSLPLPFKSDW